MPALTSPRQSLRATYVEACKLVGTRPNSHLLTVLPRGVGGGGAASEDTTKRKKEKSATTDATVIMAPDELDARAARRQEILWAAVVAMSERHEVNAEMRRARRAARQAANTLTATSSASATTTAAGTSSLSMSKQQRQKMPISAVVVVGPSGVGKGTLITKLLGEQGARYAISVSHTSRKPRAGEVDGVHYHFAAADAMRSMEARGEFLELSPVHDNVYGTTVAALNTVRASGKMPIVEVDVKGAQKIRAREAELGMRFLFMFIAPPSLTELEKRIVGRKSETPELVKLRLETARAEMDFYRTAGADFFDRSIVNVDFDVAYREFCAILNEAAQRGAAAPTGSASSPSSAAGAKLLRPAPSSTAVSLLEGTGMMPSVGAVAFTADGSSALMGIDLALNYVGPRGVAALTNAVALPGIAPNLKLLNLQGNRLNNDRVKDLCAKLQDHPALEELNLCQNPITLEGAKAVLAFLDARHAAGHRTAVEMDIPAIPGLTYRHDLDVRNSRNRAGRAAPVWDAEPFRGVNSGGVASPPSSIPPPPPQALKPVFGKVSEESVATGTPTAPSDNKPTPPVAASKRKPETASTPATAATAPVHTTTVASTGTTPAATSSGAAAPASPTNTKTKRPTAPVAPAMSPEHAAAVGALQASIVAADGTRLSALEAVLNTFTATAA
jgi:guanylate kinase